MSSAGTGGEGGSVSYEDRAMRLYRVALSLIETKGSFISVGLTQLKEFRSGTLTIHHMPSTGHLHVWYGRKVLVINRRDGKPHVSHYVPGEDWEEVLEAAAKAKPPK
jgi:hypothetical protein